MQYDRHLTAQKMRTWEGSLLAYELPSWDELPTIGLYMDQVIALLTRYLNFLPHEEGGENVTTPAMVNNYVKMRIIPPPVRKRYSRVHLAYLIMICMLKQTLNIATVQRLLPPGAPEGEVRATYDIFVTAHKRMARSFVADVREIASPLLLAQETGTPEITGLVMQAAVTASLSKLLTELLIGLGAEDVTKP